MTDSTLLHVEYLIQDLQDLHVKVVELLMQQRAEVALIPVEKRDLAIPNMEPAILQAEFDEISLETAQSDLGDAIKSLQDILDGRESV